MEIRECHNCVNYYCEVYNMVGMINRFCKGGVKELTYRKTPDAKKCELFHPTLKASNTFFIKELYDNFIDYNNIEFDKHIAHYWRIVDDKKRYKRISGDRHFFLRFRTESQLEEFYNENITLLQNCNLKYFYDTKIKLKLTTWTPQKKLQQNS